MADIRAFAAFRPKKGLERQTAALPYDVYSTEEAREVVAKEPLSFLKIDRAETSFPKEAGVDCYAEEVYQAAHDMLWERIAQGDFMKEETECYYLYCQTMKERSQTGIVACASIDDYQKQVIKKHENTREGKELDRIRHVQACQMQTGPIFLAYRSDSVLKALTERIRATEPVYDFESEDHVRHQVWIIADERQKETVREAFLKMDSIYIADGHHRCASAVKVGLQCRKVHPDYTGEEAFNSFLSVLFPEDELMILPYNRVVRDLNGYTEKEFLEKLTENFIVTSKGKEPYSPKQKGTFGMYLHGGWYELRAKQSVLSDDPVAGLDVSILQDYLLAPVLGVKNPKSDTRIGFVGGIRGLEELVRRAESDMEVAFSMYPTSIQELFAVADQGSLMPPKSTWFEPKLRSGLFLHSIQ